MAKRRKIGQKRALRTRRPPAVGPQRRKKPTSIKIADMMEGTTYRRPERYDRYPAPPPLDEGSLSSAKQAFVKTRVARPSLHQRAFMSVKNECAVRKIRKEVIFATGHGGKTGPQRPHQPKSKVRC